MCRLECTHVEYSRTGGLGSDGLHQAHVASAVNVTATYMPQPYKVYLQFDVSHPDAKRSTAHHEQTHDRLWQIQHMLSTAAGKSYKCHMRTVAQAFDPVSNALLWWPTGAVSGGPGLLPLC